MGVNYLENGAMASESLSERPDLFIYHDYRFLLRDWFLYLEACDSLMTLETIANKSRLSLKYLKSFLSGANGLDEISLGRMIPYLQLLKKEQLYVKMLRALAEGKTQEERFQTLEKINDFRSKEKLDALDMTAAKYLSHWSIVAIRELSTLPGFSENPEKIAETIRDQLCFKVSTDEIQEALVYLKENNLLGAPEKAPPVRCSGGVYRLALSKFHHDMLAKAQESIALTPRDERLILGYTLPIPQSKVSEYNAILREALEKIKALEGTTGKSDSVYQVEMALFPLAQQKRKRRK